MGASREGRDIIVELLYLLYSLAPRTDRPRCRGDVHGDHPLFRFSTVRFAPVMMQEGTARTPRHSISPPRGLYVEPPGTAVLPAFRFVIMFTALYVISPMSDIAHEHEGPRVGEQGEIGREPERTSARSRRRTRRWSPSGPSRRS